MNIVIPKRKLSRPLQKRLVETTWDARSFMVTILRWYSSAQFVASEVHGKNCLPALEVYPSLRMLFDQCIKIGFFSRLQGAF